MEGLGQYSDAINSYNQILTTVNPVARTKNIWSHPDILEYGMKKINVMLIVGKREAEAGEVSVRRRFEGDLGQMKVTELIQQLDNEINNRRRTEKSQK